MFPSYLPVKAPNPGADSFNFQDIIKLPDIINNTSNISHTIFSIVSDSDIQSFLLFHKYDKLLPVPSLKYVLFQRIPGIPGP